MDPPSHHRAVALVVVVAISVALARSLGTTPNATSRTIAGNLPAPTDAGCDAGGDAGNRLRRIDPNVGTVAALESLPGIGPALARRIVAAREHGIRFESANDLERVRGIGPRTAVRIAPWLLFGDGGARDGGARDW